MMIHNIQKQNDKTELGFWIYLMSDMVLFGALFACFQILRHNTAGGPAASELFDLPYVFIETMVLLASSVASGIALSALRAKKVHLFRSLLILTIVLGIAFLAMEIAEFSMLIHEGYSWTTSGFLSSYFTLVGTHGMHIFFGIVWGIALLVVSGSRAGKNDHYDRKVTLFTTFWHFLDLIWIAIFTVVYLMGAL